MPSGVLRSLGLLFCSLAFLQSAAVASDGLRTALEQNRTGNSAAAFRTLSELIAADSQDPRVHFLRGIVAADLQKPADADFRRGAKLEAATGNTSSVSRMLQAVQGPLRRDIERYRAEARAALKADPDAAMRKIVFRDALELRRQGRSKEALAAFAQLTDAGDDPRYFYMQGVTQLESGDRDSAAKSFAEGLTRETTLAEIRLVNSMLSRIDADVRQDLEELAVATIADQQITRTQMHAEVLRRAMTTQDQLLAENNAAAAAAEEAEQAAADAERRAIVEAIVAQREAEMAAQNPAFIEDPGTVADPNPEPEPEMPAEPAVAATNPLTPTAPSSNPFLGGAVQTPSVATNSGSGGTRATGTAPTAGPLDLGWMRDDVELVIHLRPGDIINSALVQSNPMAAMGAQTPLPIPGVSLTAADIESVTIGLGNVLATGMQVAAQAALGPPDAEQAQQIGNQLFENSGMVVMRLSKDVDSALMAAIPGGQEQTTGDATWTLVPANEAEGQPEVGVYMADARTIIAASPSTLGSAISAGAGESSRANFAFASANQILIAFSTPLLAGMSGSIPPAPQEAPPQVAALMDAVRGKISGVGIGLDMSSDAHLNISLNLIDAASASEAKTALDGGLQMGKQMAPLFMGGAPAPLQPGLGSLVNSLNSESSDTVLSLSATISKALLDALAENAGDMVPGMVPGGLPGGPGGFPGGPGGFPGGPGGAGIPGGIPGSPGGFPGVPPQQ